MRFIKVKCVNCKFKFQFSPFESSNQKQLKIECFLCHKINIISLNSNYTNECVVKDSNLKNK